MRVTSLNEGWQFRPDGPWQIHSFGPFQKELGWLPAQLPGCVHLDLVANGVIADPLKGHGDAGCAWVDHTDWRYRRVLILAKLEIGFRRVLRFGCLDTVCSIWIDGAKVAEHGNYFLPFELDLTHLEAGSHELEVRFESPFRVGNARRAAYFAKEGLPEDTKHFDARCFLRKPLYQFGWDWGPVLPSCGFRGVVKLLEFESRVLSFEVRTDKLEGEHWRVWSETSIEGDLKFTTQFGSREFRGDFDIELTSPQLWWPVGLGEAALHPAIVSTANGVTGMRNVGFRTIALDRRTDEMGESFCFIINGRPFFAKGANTIPNWTFHSSERNSAMRHNPLEMQRMQDEREAWEAINEDGEGFAPSILLEATLPSADWAHADIGSVFNANMLRVWGGGMMESDRFYDQCDESGILVWQDFPFACFYAPDDAENRAIIRSEAEYHVKRLRHHPSLALFCGNNEVHQMHQQKWAGELPRFYGEAIFEQDLREIAQINAPNIPYISTSPIGENPSGEPDPAAQTTINMGGWGDQHYWDVWHGRGDWVHYKDAFGRFSSEFGFASAPCPGIFAESIERLDTLWHHDRTGKARGTIESLVELHYPRATNNIEWIYSSQLNQRDAMRFAIEHFRTCGYCSGSLIWQYNDCWPGQTWSLLDYSGTPKIAGWEVLRLYHPLLVAPELLGDSLLLRLVADNAEESGFWVDIEFSDAEGEITFSAELEVLVSEGEHTPLHQPEQVEIRIGERLHITSGISKYFQMNIPRAVLEKSVVFRANCRNQGGFPRFRPLREPKDTRWVLPEITFKRRRISKSEAAVRIFSSGLALDAGIFETHREVLVPQKTWRCFTLRNDGIELPIAHNRRFGVIVLGPNGYHTVYEP